MALRSGHGNGAGSPHIEVMPADELPAGVPAEARQESPRDRGERGKFAPGNSLARQGGHAKRGTSRLTSRLGLAMVDAKRRDLRVREDNPALRVAAPERGEVRAKSYLYPSEFRSLVECKGIDVAFRTLYAVAVYTYARAGELEALTWDDVDLEHGVIHITKAINRDSGEVQSTKSGITRRIPIEPELRPLLLRLKAERKEAKGRRVLWMPDNEDRAVMLRSHLRDKAGVKRAELFADDAHRKHVTFHDLRATGITWAAVRGDDPLRIKQRAGHSSFSTTEIYIREAENLCDGFGEPFPPLPPDLTGGGSATVLDSATGTTTPKPNLPASEWSNGGSNPGPLHCERSALPAELLPQIRHRRAPVKTRPATRGPGRYAGPF
jgi:integrase